MARAGPTTAPTPGGAPACPCRQRPSPREDGLDTDGVEANCAGIPEPSAQPRNWVESEIRPSKSTADTPASVTPGEIPRAPNSMPNTTTPDSDIWPTSP
eukprot:4768399-Pyramimonas_sp.AAC.1